MNFKLRSLVAATLAGSMLMGFGTSAMADSTDDILNALIAKGILTEEEGALLQKGRTGEKEAAAAKKSKTPVVKEKDGAFALESADGANSVQLTGRMHFDYRNSDINNLGSTGAIDSSTDVDSKTMADQFELRRARIGVKGKIAKDFKYEVVANLPGVATIDVAYLDFARYEQAQLRFGKFKQPIGLEQLTSSNNIDFMERSFVDQFVPAKKMGVMLNGSPTSGLTYAGSVYQPNDTEQDMSSDKASYAGRVTYNFGEAFGNKDVIAHFGLSGFDSDYALQPATTGNTSSTSDGKTRASLFSIRSGGRGLGNMYRAQIGGETITPTCTAVPSTGTTTCTVTGDYHLGNSNTAQVESKAYGLEGILAYGPFKVQGEYLNNDIEGRYRDSTVTSDVNAYYAEALWLVTGEKYADFYKKGAFGGITPKNSLDLETGKGGWGALEVGFRFDQVEANSSIVNGTSLTNSRVQGSTANKNSGSLDTCSSSTSLGSKDCGKGGAKSYTAGLKWILNPNVLFKLNYTHTKFDQAFAPIDIGATRTVAQGTNTIDSEDLVMLRGQFAF
ncbi:Phosphate-selective porin O/P [Methylophilaceae bacterium]